MVSEKFIAEVSRFKQKELKRQKDVINKLLDDILNGRFNGDIYESLNVYDDISDITNQPSEVGLDEDELYEILSLTLMGREIETFNKTDSNMDSERWCEVHDVTCEEIFNVTNVELRDNVVDVLLSEIDSGLFDEILFGLDFDCDEYRSRIKTIITKLQYDEVTY